MRPTADTDADGMPDAWEVGHTLNPTLNDATQDADADGTANLTEYIAGTDPTDPLSSLRFSLTRLLPGTHVSLSWPSVSGRTYALEFTGRLPSSVGWQTLTNQIAGTGSTLRVEDIPIVSTNRFYRLGVRKN